MKPSKLLLQCQCHVETNAVSLPTKGLKLFNSLKLDLPMKVGLHIFYDRQYTKPRDTAWHSDITYEQQPAGLTFLKVNLAVLFRLRHATNLRNRLIPCLPWVAIRCGPVPMKLMIACLQQCKSLLKVLKQYMMAKSTKTDPDVQALLSVAISLNPLTQLSALTLLQAGKVLV